MLADLCGAYSYILRSVRQLLFSEQITSILEAIALFIAAHLLAIVSLLCGLTALFFILRPVNIVRDFEYYGCDHLINNNQTKESNLRSLSEKDTRERYRGEQPPVYPNGWIPLMESRLLLKGQVQSIRAIGQQFAVFRDSNGKFHVMDAYCPHLGANLAVGGRVIGDCLECPSHGWQFRGEDGACSKIPYADKVPDFVRVKKWRSIETNGFIFVWFHAEGDDPSWYPTELPHVNDGSWSFVGKTQHIVNCHIQEISENVSDVAHLNQIHAPAALSGSNLLHMYNFKYSFIRHSWQLEWKDGDSSQLKHEATATVRHSLYLFGYKISFLDVDMCINQIGPALTQVNFKAFGGEGVLVTSLTPEAPGRQRVTQIGLSTGMSARLLCKLMLLIEDIMIRRDIVVWNNKKYEKSPVLTKEEKALLRHRRWYSQFYSESSPSFEGEMRKMYCLKYDW